MELYERTNQRTKSRKCAYPVFLDADWGSNGSLMNEEALCLDASHFGNVARFINHRYAYNLLYIYLCANGCIYNFHKILVSGNL